MRGGNGCIFVEDEGEDLIEFMLVLHEMYPWCGPYLVVTTQVTFPRLDDGRDVLEDVIDGEWWPDITAADVIDKLPSFVHGKIEAKVLNSSVPIFPTSF